MINIEQLDIQYPDGRMAIAGLSCRIGARERVALLGANGAGKSSLLLSLVGLAPITAGRVFVDEAEVTPKTIRAVRQKTGLLFQNPDDQLFCIRVRDDIAFGPQNLGWPEQIIREKTQAVMDLLEIADLAEFPPHKLSGGEKRKVTLAGILVMAPEILLFDEPTAFLDPRSQRELAAVISGLPQTCLIATHDLNFAKKTCSRAIVLDNGRLVRTGEMRDILADEGLLSAHGLI